MLRPEVKGEAPWGSLWGNWQRGCCEHCSRVEDNVGLQCGDISLDPRKLQLPEPDASPGKKLTRLNCQAELRQAEMEAKRPEFSNRLRVLFGEKDWQARVWDPNRLWG